jgi:hypothetical protein
MFPISIQDSVAIIVDSTASSKAILKTLRDQIELLEPYIVTVEGDTLRFETRMFKRMGSYNLLRPISEGRISVELSGDTAIIDFKLSFEDMISTVSVMVTFMAILLFGMANLNGLGAVLVFPAAWLWLIGGNFMITSIRFPLFIRCCFALPIR